MHVLLTHDLQQVHMGREPSDTDKRQVLLELATWGAAMALLRPGWAAAMLLLAVTALVPLALRLVAGQPGSRPARIAARFYRWGRWPGAILLGASFALSPGPWATALAVPWLIMAICVAVMGLDRLLRHVRGPVHEAATGYGMVFLAGGAGWAVLSRGGLRPMEFSDLIVLLTAVHFHFAGCLLPILIGLAGRGLADCWTSLAAALAAVGVPLLAVGFTYSPSIELLAAGLLAAACVLLAVQQFRLALGSNLPGPLMLWSVSSLSVLTAMTLAAIYAWGEYSGHKFLDIPRMLPLHGGLQGLGFVLPSLLAWRGNAQNPS
ncbi:MAG: YndJ family transporter [Pirellulales bacterium]